MRPKNLDEFFGQEHILAKGKLLRRAIQADQLSSLIFYGPPGTGKTTLARVIALHTKGHFLSINAVLAGIKQIRDSISEAERRLGIAEQKSILFVDEVHRFNKSQQDALLPHVENGTIILIGATTENPYFEVNKALVSRSRIFELKPLSKQNLASALEHALCCPDRGYGRLSVRIDDSAKQHLIRTSSGDARSLLNALELAIEPELQEGVQEVHIDLEKAEQSIQKRAVLYDKDGDAHYDIISAFIKSIRGSDPDAALYWMAKMVTAGEDPRFIFRRMLISASEDVGMAAPEVLGIVESSSRAYDYVGMPEGRFHLAHACLALCNAPKSNSAFGFFDALGAVAKESSNDEVPNHLKDKSRDAKDFGHGAGYKYPHAFQDHWVAQQYLPDGLRNRLFYQPSDQGFEKEVKENVEKRRELAYAAFAEESAFSYIRKDSQNEQDKWHSRGKGQDHLKWLRDTLLSLSGIQRDDLILDFHAGSGYLSFEATRISKTGGVYSIAWNHDEAEVLRKLSSKFPQFERPIVIDHTPEDWLTQIPQELEGVKFNHIILRNFWDKNYDVDEYLKLFEQMIESGGRISSFDYIYQDDPHLSSFLSSNSENSEIIRKFAKAENDFFSSDFFPSNFSAANINENCNESWKINLCQEHQLDLEKVFDPTTLKTWFGPNGRLGQFLRGQYSEDEIGKFAELCSGQLTHKKLTWPRKCLLMSLEAKG
ncbi:MAG: AAA family ATPase [Planctomycetes bacterium]|nr:AAA family ATPase [Planctomycetota bacterium]